MRSVSCFAACPALGLSVVCAHAGVFQQWNLVVTGNLQNNSQDIEGRALIGGNLTGGAVTVGLNLTPASNYIGQDVLAVAGNTSVSHINLQAGNFRHGGSLSGGVNFNGVSQLTIASSVSAAAAAAANEMLSASTFLAGLTPNSVMTYPSGQPGPVTFTAAPSGPQNIAVFSVSAANAFNNPLIQQYNLTPGAASSIIINVSGSTVSLTNGNMTGNWNTPFARSNVIWNFYEATLIDLQRNISGTILAPHAHLSNSTAIDGSVYVASFNQSGEVHLPLYQGYIPAPGAGMALGVAGLIVARRRR